MRPAVGSRDHPDGTWTWPHASRWERNSSPECGKVGVPRWLPVASDPELQEWLAHLSSQTGFKRLPLVREMVDFVLPSAEEDAAMRAHQSDWQAPELCNKVAVYLANKWANPACCADEQACREAVLRFSRLPRAAVEQFVAQDGAWLERIASCSKGLIKLQRSSKGVHIAVLDFHALAECYLAEQKAQGAAAGTTQGGNQLVAPNASRAAGAQPQADHQHGAMQPGLAQPLAAHSFLAQLPTPARARGGSNVNAQRPFGANNSSLQGAAEYDMQGWSTGGGLPVVAVPAPAPVYPHAGGSSAPGTHGDAPSELAQQGDWGPADDHMQCGGSGFEHDGGDADPAGNLGQNHLTQQQQQEQAGPELEAGDDDRLLAQDILALPEEFGPHTEWGSAVMDEVEAIRVGAASCILCPVCTYAPELIRTGASVIDYACISCGSCVCCITVRIQLVCACS